MSQNNTSTKAFENPARIDQGKEPLIKTDYEHPCSEPVLFAMKDQHHEFSMGLSVILNSLRLAEKTGYVPPLDETWWRAIHAQYEGEEWNFLKR